MAAHALARCTCPAVPTSNLQLPGPVTPRPAISQRHLHPHHIRNSRSSRHHAYASQGLVDALGGKGLSAPQRAWWNDQQELFAAVHTEAELEQELQGNGKELIVVGAPSCFSLTSFKSVLADKPLQQQSVHADFYGTWCVGCAKVYPDVCRVAADPVLRQRCHFVKVCVDNLKDRMKADKVRQLPYLGFFSPTSGKLLGYVNLPSKSRLLRANIEKMLENNGAKFALDPNGYAMVTEAATTNALNTEEEMELNLQEMQKEREQMFAGPNIPVFTTVINWAKKITMSGDEDS